MCSFSVNYDKTVFILIHVRRAEVHARATATDGATHGECGAMRGYGGGSSRPAERVTAASGSILTVGQSGGAPRAAAAGAGAGAGGAVFLRHGSERDDGDGDGDVE
ncbi:hypothetical protein EVAR_66810_1 [Eumeta japonica]|uniref:Uncharacterized protein n=1 Tax=Eumeta variegata TaxID=151549 RepID=A0A4C1ZZH1_EUMVA|nr:hypothetical protein EVAR_66810_1 [Eumeta japonica]